MANKCPLPSVISLFSGAGGLDLGFASRGFDISLAIDLSEAAIRTHQRNFPSGQALVADLLSLGPEGVLEHARKEVGVGGAIGVIGGPPCQGFSRANTRSQADDPRNRLPSLYLNIVALLKEHYLVEFVVFENVLGIRDKKHVGTYSQLLNGLSGLGFSVSEQVLCSLDFGVPQTRKRVIVSGVRDKNVSLEISPIANPKPKTVREAIGHLPEPVYFRRGLEMSDIPYHPNHWTMMPKSPKFSQQVAPDNRGRSFKRLSWDEPSRTIAFGNREIYVHPNGHRRLSILEAMLLQGFSTDFVLEGNLSQQVEQISNAVPPPLACGVAEAVKGQIRNFQG